MSAINTVTDISKDEETDAVLTAFAVAQTAPGGADLAEWVTRHPAQARDLTRLAADAWGNVDSDIAAPDTEARMRNIGLAALRACRPEPKAAPLASLLAAAKAAGLGADGVAAKMDLPVALFWKLHRRLIAPDSLPGTLIASLAEAVDRTRDEIAAYLRMPPQLAAGASYRSDDAPTVGDQEPFAEALIAEPEATEAQRRRWLGEA